MGSLIARTPLAGLGPLTHGTCVLTEQADGPITSLAPMPGRADALSKAMQKAHGLPFPAPNRMVQKGPARVLWSGRDQAFLIGVPPAAALATHAARSQLQHVMLLIARSGPQVFGLMVMRSFAVTAWHEVSEAMKSVAARG